MDVGIILLVALQIYVYVTGCRNAYIRGRIDASRDLMAAQNEINQTLKLAEMKGIDTSKLTPEEIIQMTMERRKELEKKEKDSEFPI